MDVHHNLAAIYDAHRNEITAYLQAAYGAVQKEVENKKKYSASLSLNLTVLELKIGLIINIPFNFPDAFPQIKLDEPSFKKVFPIPHLNIFRTLCLFDEVVASPNPHNPIGIMKTVLEKAEEVLNKGLLKQNAHDFMDEFESYWIQESEKGSFFNLVEPGERIKAVYLVPGVLKSQKNISILTDSKSDAVRWIQNVGGSYNEDLISEIIYVPLKNLFPYPYPKNNIEIYRLLKQNESLNINDYFTYLNKNQRPAKALFSIRLNDSFLWGIWEHQKPSKRNTTLYKGKKVNQKSLRGFRKESKNGLLELARDFPNVEIKKYYVEDVRTARLKTRGGDGELKHQSKKVAVIGCGAVGSHLTQALIDIGVQHLLLVDPDTLSFENINRHLCGADQVGSKKTEAIKQRLNKHFPTSQIHIYSDNVLSLLNQHPEGLNSYDLIVCAISHIPTELRLNELQRNGILTTPIVDIWVEPYLAAGHAIWIEPASKIDLNSIFQNGKFRYQVLKNGNQYAKKELGCNTSYVPYGVLDLKKFIIDVAMFINDQWNNEQRNNLILTWLGNLSENRNHKRLLEPKWVGAADFSLRYSTLENKNESVE